ncbi:MAG: 23S rRNA (uracil(1939)-C(5))-methyltransferase RlmD [Erysipelotrichaceae bacterium]
MECIKNNCQFCLLPKLSYQETIAEKQKQIKGLFPQYQSLILPMVEMGNPYYYRHKVTASFKMIKGKLVAGIYEENSHQLIENKGCMMQHQLANQIIESTVQLANKFKMEAYNEDKRQGLLRHIQLRISHTTNDVLVTLVLGEKIFKSRQNFIKEMMKKHPEIKSVVCNYNFRKTSIVLSDKEEISYGTGAILDNLLQTKFLISSQSFYQINPIQTEKLYQAVMDYANIGKEDVVLDTYCGIGTMSLIASRYAKKVIGVELIPSSVKDANKNKKINQITNCHFIQMDATKYMILTKEKIDILIMDPTRSGSTPEFLNAVNRLKPRKVIYVSCNPETQVIDLKLLQKNYKIDVIQGFDLFPFSKHVESLVILSR